MALATAPAARAHTAGQDMLFMLPVEKPYSAAYAMPVSADRISPMTASLFDLFFIAFSSLRFQSFRGRAAHL